MLGGGRILLTASRPGLAGPPVLACAPSTPLHPLLCLGHRGDGGGSPCGGGPILLWWGLQGASTHGVEGGHPSGWGPPKPAPWGAPVPSVEQQQQHLPPPQ